LRAGLRRDQCHAEDLASNGFEFVERLDDLDPTALAATAGMDLRFDDPNRTAKVLSQLYRFYDGVRDPAARDGDAVLGQDAFCLVLVNIHAGPILVSEPPGGTAA